MSYTRIARRGGGRPRFAVLALALAAAALLPHATADVVTTHDGRRFEGKILESDEEGVRLDAMVAGVRVTMTLSRSEVAGEAEAPLVPDFFDPREEAPARVSGSGDHPKGATLYLEVPVKGRFGEQVVLKGVQRALTYATTHGIGHVVFVVDSKGGDQVEAREIFHLLKRYDDQLTFYAVVREAVGVAMAVPVWCDHVFVLPGAQLGGVHITPDPEVRPGDPEVVLGQIGYEVDQIARDHGWPEGLVRAMVDPSREIAGWRGADGQATTGVLVPEGIDDAGVLFRDGSDDLLTLTGEVAVALGAAKALSEGAAQIGSTLGLEAWSRESEVGRKAMELAARQHAALMAKKQARLDVKIKRNVHKREATAAYIERHIQIAHEWSPTKGKYSTYETHRDEWLYWWGPNYRENVLTPESQKKWRHLTDITFEALRRARKGVIEMRRLDKEAAKLGLDPTYGEERLVAMQQDFEVKMQLLAKHRNRTTK
jgi:hypothetical protein